MNKADRKHIISTQLTIIIVGLLVLTLLTCFLVNVFFLEDYYILEKSNVLRTAYRELEAKAGQSALHESSTDIRLDELSNTYSLDILVIDNDSNIVKYFGRNQEEMRFRIWDRLFLGSLSEEATGEEDREEKDNDIIEQNEYYEISLSTDIRSHREYVELWGSIDGGLLVLLRVPLESIKESVNIANKMMAYTGFVAIIAGAIVIWIVSRKITRPILELTEISQRIGELDFQATYSGRGHNEINTLGENINKLSQSLEKTISELKTANNELTRDIKKREELDAMRGEFIANVSHELKTPLALIQGYAEGILEGIYSDTSTRDYYLEVICDEASKMNTMVKRLVTLNQLEFGENSVDMERFDLIELVEGCVQAMQVLMDQKNITVSYTESEPVFVWGDEFLVEEVIMNYLSNGINHCGGEKRIDIKVEKEGDKVVTTVFNTGSPIDDEAIPHLWEKFYKVDKARTRAYGGSGIGLSIVKAIMDSMNQQVGVRNYDNGVAFFFTLDSK